MNNLCLIDGDSIIYYSCYTKEGQVKSIKDVLNCVDYYINSILFKTQSNFYSGFLTDYSFRYALAKIKPYKGNRKDFIKPSYFKMATAYLLDEYKFTTKHNYEADDLCIMAHNTFKNSVDYNPIIATPDKDLKQIAATFYDYKKGETIEVNSKDAFKNLWKQVLTGDAGDNIQGLQGIGDVKAEKILKDSTDYRSTVLNEYIRAYGEYQGILNFTETYQLVKMVDTLDGELYYPNIYQKELTTEELLDEWFNREGYSEEENYKS